MTMMEHNDFGRHEIDPKRVEKLLKRGWKIVEEVETPTQEEQDNDEQGDV